MRRTLSTLIRAAGSMDSYILTNIQDSMPAVAKLLRMVRRNNIIVEPTTLV